MKIVINKCYGGFGISNEALHELIKLNASCIESQKFTEYSNSTSDPDWELKEDGIWYHRFSAIAINKSIIDVNNILLSTVYFLKRDDSIRSNPDLINIIEKLGKNAGGQFSKLKIVEIPDKVNWEIDEYDGMETVREISGRWG